ncbi:GT2 family glycosyltransferase [Fontibacillus solani]|uniref:GT2 family glycosyltransferase n=1 Tax=Fontibacillus solani TaxID=1572857 RepID=A0A7W3SQU7_9BACL|nr:glycosyltransferase family 2 protein [Fontibacillus solani]MBA9084508.1 GT2 family glycosyltransferase [Fontibacillus solani]
MKNSQRDFQRGYEAGYARGAEIGRQSFGSPFEGTSIIIPTYNRKDLLVECLDSIEAYTEQPYEIIVVDNGSNDGTVKMLRRRGGALRIGVHSQNLGFARAVNTGLMMAKGSTIVLLNNDVLVTERWLSQLLRCLNESPGAAAVGPVTNYIGGEQQMDVPYTDIPGMREFAARHNRYNPGLWRKSERLVGYCILFSRRTFEQVGYFDEGYKVGNFEDDDWMVRIRFQGKGMTIAGDTFVHHYGSMTMRELGSNGYIKVNTRNQQFFEEKWGSPHEMLNRMQPLLNAGSLRNIDFYPSYTWINDSAGRLFWLEHGVKHAPVNGMAINQSIHHTTRLSVMDMLQIPSGPQLLASEVKRSPKGLSEGAVIRNSCGILFQIDRGQRREMLSHYTCEAWGLHITEVLESERSELMQLPTGLPILPPPRLLSDDL